MEHYFSEKQNSKLDLKKINVKSKNLDFNVFSAKGVFSKNRLDKGTKLLIENAIVRGKVLDLGCGIGIVGICIKKLNQKLDVTMSDVNERALEIAKMNSKNLDVKIVKSDVFNNLDEEFDVILLNPPQAAGKETCFRMIRESFEHLKKNGFFELVARHNKGGKTYMNYMKEIFGNVKDIVKESGYRVYLAKKLI
ncbi:class I SAM-dependent methyltransferase [Candidatus Woesearchaeota archaeon]|nr:class I SAM-dependent methyltransferase [Candidatus Woesearchaeota archaeon]